MYDVIIVGAGPAGMTSAIYLARAGISAIVLEREFCGGKMNYASDIRNYPGFESISGIDLSEKMFNHVKDLNVEIEYANITNSSLSGNVKYVTSSNGKEYSSKCVIIATGLRTKSLKCKGEDKFKGKGVSYCATCDGFFFKNKNVAVIGDGNIAFEEAIYLSSICNKVYIIMKKNLANENSENFVSVQNNSKIEIIFDTSVKEIKGNNKVESIILTSKNEDIEMNIDGVFIAIGNEPENGPFPEIKSNSLGFFDSNESCSTNIDGVFVAGDCKDKFLRQIVTAASDGATSSAMAIKYLKTSSKKLVSV